MPKRDISRSLRWMREGTERRRSERSRRNQKFWLFSATFLAMLVVCLPSLICYSPLPYSWTQSAASELGWKVRVGSVRIGWVTPLRIADIEAVGPSGDTILVADSIDAPLTVWDLLRGGRDWGTLNIDRLRVETALVNGSSRFEEDIQALLEGPAADDPWQGEIAIRNASVKVSSGDALRNWRLDQVQVTTKVGAELISAQCEAVLTDPMSISGSIQVDASLPMEGDGSEDIKIVLNSQGVPLSFLELCRIRFPEFEGSFPESWSGNMTGSVAVSLGPLSSTSIELRGIDLRNLVVADSRITENRPWKIGQATAEGLIRFQHPNIDCQKFHVVTEAGRLQVHGVLDLDALTTGQVVKCLRGEFLSELDLAILTQATPGLIPLKENVSVQSGRMRASVIGVENKGGEFRTSATFMTEPIVASVLGGRPINIQPMTADLIVRPSQNWMITDRFDIQSSFGTARASGDHLGGEVNFHVDLGELDGILRSLLILPQTPLGGIASGKMRWSVTNGNRWVLDGSAGARNLTVPLFSGDMLVRPQLDLHVSAEGVYTQNQLQQLNRAVLQLSEPGQRWDVSLQTPVEKPSAESRFPIKVKGNGSLVTLATWLKPIAGTKIRNVRGEIEAEVIGEVGLDGGTVRSLDFVSRNLEAIIEGKKLTQSNLKTQFRGEARWPDASLRADQFTCSGNAVSFAARGSIDRYTAEFEVAYRMNLEQAQNSWQTVNVPAESFLPTTIHSPVDADWLFYGDADGKLRISRKRDAGGYAIILETNAKDLQVFQPPAVVYAQTTGGTIKPTSANLQPQLIWEETDLTVGGELAVSADFNEFQIPDLRITSSWVTTQIAGSMIVDRGDVKALVQGPTTLNMREASKRLTRLLGEPILFQGSHKTDISLAVDTRRPDGEVFEVIGSLGWDRAELPGIVVGPANVPIRVSETSVFVSNSTIPLQSGQVHLGGEVHFRPGELWIRQQPGRFAEGVTFNPDMCRTWLKYLLPLAADATDVSGAFSVDLTECVVYPNNPALSRIAGAIQVDSAAIGPGPLTRTVIGLIDQVEAAAKGFAGGQVGSVEPKQWLQMDAQSIDFSVADGVVSHERMFAKAGKVSLISSGRVGFSGGLSLGIQVPLEATWLGSDLDFLAGRTMTVPIQGTLSQPRVDPQSVGKILSEFGAQAIQSGAENFFQKQLDRQFQKLFGN